MLNYPSFVYLQNHKTGCTFVETCLREFCAEPLLGYNKHAVLEQAPGKFCFINVREPLPLYRSLFAYGLDGKGTVFHRLKRLGHGSLYEQGAQGFEGWLDFVIRPVNAPLLADAYTPAVAKLLGFMSWRFVRLACPGFEDAAKEFADVAAMKIYIDQHNVVNAVIRQECLNDDLKKLIQGKLAAYFPDQQAVLAWLDGAARVNASESSVNPSSLRPDLLARVLRKESILYQTFYPDEFKQLKQDLIPA